jgi:hypothetical protein
MFVKNDIGSGAKRLWLLYKSPKHIEASEKIDFFGKKAVWCMRLTAAIAVFILYILAE